MKFQLEHGAIHCKDLNESIKFYEKYYGAHPTAIRKGTAGYGFCFMVIDGAPAIQLMESAGEVGVHHYGFVSDNVEELPKSLKKKARRSSVKSRSVGEPHNHIRQGSKRLRNGDQVAAFEFGIKRRAARSRNVPPA